MHSSNMHSRSSSPTENLKEEHRVIERMLKILNDASDRLERGEDVSSEVFEKAVDFVRNFADKCHHAKEENNLFPVMEKHGFSKQTGPVGVMLMEHDQGRAFVRRLNEALQKYRMRDKNAKQDIIKNARGYTTLLAQHIPKEDEILYPMADNVLGQSEQEELLRKFEEIELKQIGEGKHNEYLHIVTELEKQLNIS